MNWVGNRPILSTELAQLVEHRSPKPSVGRSSRSFRAKHNGRLTSRNIPNGEYVILKSLLTKFRIEKSTII